MFFTKDSFSFLSFLPDSRPQTRSSLSTNHYSLITKHRSSDQEPGREASERITDLNALSKDGSMIWDAGRRTGFTKWSPYFQHIRMSVNYANINNRVPYYRSVANLTLKSICSTSIPPPLTLKLNHHRWKMISD